MNSPPRTASCPFESSPQQTRVPPTRIAQVWAPPAETAVNVPAGIPSSWPSESSPQQTRVPPTRIAQVWAPPAETAVNVPAGIPSSWPFESSPQHASPPSARIAQLWVPPAENVPAPNAVSCPSALAPAERVSETATTDASNKEKGNLSKAQAAILGRLFGFSHPLLGFSEVGACGRPSGKTAERVGFEPTASVLPRIEYASAQAVSGCPSADKAGSWERPCMGLASSVVSEAPADPQEGSRFPV